MTATHPFKKTLIVIFLITLLSLGTNIVSADKKLAKRVIKVAQHERSFYMRYPINYESQTRFPLVIVLHGGDRKNGDEAAHRTGFDSLADKGNFIAVFPNGFKGKWHDGRLPSKERKQKKYLEKQNNDIAFLKQLIDHMVEYEQVDPKRVYMTGMSNGGMMTMRMACEASDKLAAIAPIIANMPVEIVEGCLPSEKLSFLLMNGTDDPLVPYQGGEIRAFKKRGKVLSAKATINFWRQHNDCGKVSETITLANKNTKDRSVIGKTSYSCDAPIEMVLYTVRGGGHTLPGSNIPNRPRLLGQKNMDANGAELIWTFLSKQKKP